MEDKIGKGWRERRPVAMVWQCNWWSCSMVLHCLIRFFVEWMLGMSIHSYPMRVSSPVLSLTWPFRCVLSKIINFLLLRWNICGFVVLKYAI
jgi:hypothetical protein